MAVLVGVVLKEETEGPVNVPLSVPVSAQHTKATPESPRTSLIEGFTYKFDSAKEPLAIQESRIWGSVETSLSVEAARPSDTRIRLEKGKIVAEVDSDRLNKKFVVMTPSAHIEVRGTVFSVEIVPGGAETVRVMEGIVAITDLSCNGRFHLLSANQQIIIGDTTVSKAIASSLQCDFRLERMDASNAGMANDLSTSGSTGHAAQRAVRSRSPNGHCIRCESPYRIRGPHYSFGNRF